MSITQTPFGQDAAGHPITLFTMTNARGASASVINYGAHLQSVRVPDRNGTLCDVALGFDTIDGYMKPHGYMGATIGRCGNRISGGRFQINGETYTLYQNDGKNTLHGGREGFDAKWWSASAAEGAREDAVAMTYIAHDGEEGFPGKLHVQVTYGWDDNCNLSIRYLAQSDKDTVVNLTNHSYFNLSGHGDMLAHTLQVSADHVTHCDDALIPDGTLLPVKDTLLDLNTPQVIGDIVRRRAENHLLDNAGGFDVNYVPRGEGMRQVAVLYDAQSGRRMRVSTVEPGIQVYTGQGLNCDGRNGAHYGAYAGVALETQHHPDSVNIPAFPSVILKKGDTYQTATIYAFDVE